jgi:hypothetical protein
MVRARLAVLTLASALGFVSGCMNLPHCPLFGRHCEVVAPEACCDAEGSVVSDGPILGDPGSIPVVPPGPGAVVGPPAPPNGTMPPAPPGRLVPQPQSTPTPYTPTRK